MTLGGVPRAARQMPSIFPAVRSEPELIPFHSPIVRGHGFGGAYLVLA